MSPTLDICREAESQLIETMLQRRAAFRLVLYVSKKEEAEWVTGNPLVDRLKRWEKAKQRKPGAG